MRDGGSTAIIAKEKAGGVRFAGEKSGTERDYIRQWGNRDSKAGGPDQEVKLLITMSNKYLKKNPGIFVEELLGSIMECISE